MARDATSAGPTASRLATTSVPAAMDRDDPRRHNGLHHHPQVGRKGVPDEPAGGDAQRDADHDPDDGDGRGLPGDGQGDLAADEAERLQQSHLLSPPVQAGEQHVEQRRHAEQDDDQTEDQREVDRLSEVDEIGGRPGEVDLARVGPAQAWPWPPRPPAPVRCER